MLNSKLIRDLVEDAVRIGLRKRYPNFNGFTVDYNPQDGMVKITFALRSGNLSSAVCSLTSLDYIHLWLDRFDKLNPKVSAYFCGGPCPDFHDGWDEIR